MADTREFQPGSSVRSVQRTNDAGELASFPASVIYDENAQPVPLLTTLVRMCDTLSLLLDRTEELIGEARVIRVHLESITDETITPEEV